MYDLVQLMFSNAEDSGPKLGFLGGLSFVLISIGIVLVFISLIIYFLFADTSDLLPKLVAGGAGSVIGGILIGFINTFVQR